MAYSILRLTAAATCCWPRVTFLPILFDMSDVVKTRTISCLWLIVLPVSEVPLLYQSQKPLGSLGPTFKSIFMTSLRRNVTNAMTYIFS